MILRPRRFWEVRLNVLNMADGEILLLVDAFEGPMPPNPICVGKGANLRKKKPIVVVNKVDKSCRPDEVKESVFELMFNLGDRRSIELQNGVRIGQAELDEGPITKPQIQTFLTCWIRF